MGNFVAGVVVGVFVGIGGLALTGALWVKSVSEEFMAAAREKEAQEAAAAEAAKESEGNTVH